MQYRALGKTGIQLSEIGYGAAALFGKNVLGKQGITEEQAYELIRTAIESGVTFFDTGFNYGYSEERLGRCISRAIKEGITTRESLVIETKFGETLKPDGSYGPADLSPNGIKKNLEISLKRLQLDYVDLFAIHGGNISDFTDEFFSTLNDLKSKGLIKAYGANTFDTEVLKRIAKNNCFDYVMLDYNIIRQNREPLIKELTDAGVAVIAGSAMGESLYSKKVTNIKSLNDFWYMARALVRFKDLRKKSKNFEFLTKVKGYTANQLALRFVLDNEQITSAVFGTTNVQHLKDNLKAKDITMPAKVRAEIKKRA